MMIMEQEVNRIKELRERLEYYNYLYYVKNEPVVSDQEFDGMPAGEGVLSTMPAGGEVPGRERE